MGIQPELRQGLQFAITLILSCVPETEISLAQWLRDSTGQKNPEMQSETVWIPPAKHHGLESQY